MNDHLYEDYKYQSKVSNGTLSGHGYQKKFGNINVSK